MNMENQGNIEQSSSNTSHETTPEEIKLPTPEEMGIVQVETNEDEKPQEPEEKPKDEARDEAPPVPEPKREFSEIEKKALEQGWTPKDQFRGNPEDWRGAKEWVDRGELLDKLSSSHRAIKGLTKSNEQMSELIQRLSTRLDEKDNSDLIMARNDAIAAGNVELVNKIDEEIGKINQNRQIMQQKQQTLDPAYYQFQEKHNDWFNPTSAENKMMHDYAVNTENWLMQQYPSLSISERLDQVEEAVKKAYPHRFKSKTVPQQDYKPNFSAVEGSKPAPTKKKELGYNDLSEEDKAVVRNMCRYNDILSRDDYAKELFRTGVAKS